MRKQTSVQDKASNRLFLLCGWRLPVHTEAPASAGENHNCRIQKSINAESTSPVTGKNYCKRNPKLNVRAVLQAVGDKDMDGYGKMHPPSERLGNKHIFSRNKQDTDQAVAIHALSFRKHVKIYGGSSKPDIPGLFWQTEIRKVTRKPELRKGFQFLLSATKRHIHIIKFVVNEITLHSNTSLRKNKEKSILNSKIHFLKLFLPQTNTLLALSGRSLTFSK